VQNKRWAAHPTGEHCPLPPRSVTIAELSFTLRGRKTGKKQELTRVEGSEGKGIVGKWTDNDYTRTKQVMHFTANMNCYFSVPMFSLTGFLSANSDRLTKEFPKKGTGSGNGRSRKTLFALTRTDGTKVEKYKRKKWIVEQNAPHIVVKGRGGASNKW